MHLVQATETMTALAMNLSAIGVVLVLVQASSGIAASNSEPQLCPPGKYGRLDNSGRLTCYDCSNGHYQDKPGQKDCIPCPVGHMCPAPKTRAIPCPPGTASRGFISDRITCAKCSNGYYQDKQGQKECLSCPQGHMCPAPKTQAIPCLPGTVSRGFISDRITCYGCSNGYYQDKSGQKECLSCPQGHMCPAPKTQAIPCLPGTVSRGFISDRISCAECSNGYYQDKQGQRNCLPCPLGRYCPPPKNRAIPCPAGTISRWYLADRVNCAACSNGEYQDKIGQRICLLCPEGHECPSPKNGSIPCPPGYQNGYYRNKADLINCLACGAGYYQNKETQTRCILCPEGHSCPQKENGPVPCPPGFTSASTPSHKISCVRCSPGQCLGPVTPPVVCQAGMFLDSDTELCMPCETGKYQADPGQSSCQICPEGFYCPSTTGKPIPCPAGTYSTKEMGVRTSCLACSIGTYQVQKGQNLCLPCPAGHFCPNPSFDPVPCPAGSYSTDSTTDRTKCLPCSTREYQDRRGQQQCKPCPAGYLCPRSDLSPQQCPPNTYSNNDLTDRGQCLPCPRDQYQDQCGQAQCKGLFANGTSPPPGPNLTCPTLNGSKVVAEVCGDFTRSAYSGASVRSVEGNKGVQYPVVKILPEHLPQYGNVTDDEILVSTALAFDRMATAAKKDGVTIAIRSGFRTIQRQEYMYNCFITKKCNDGHLAAIPGTSNHGTGIALDLTTNCGSQAPDQPPPPECAESEVYTWLKDNGHKFGFVRTVQTEPWHWEFQGGPVDGRSSFT